MQPPSMIFFYVIYAGIGLVAYRRVKRVSLGRDGTRPGPRISSQSHQHDPTDGLRNQGVKIARS